MRKNKEKALGRDLSAGQALLTEANRRAISKNLERMYPTNDEPVFVDLLAQIHTAERKPKSRKPKSRKP